MQIFSIGISFRIHSNKVRKDNPTETGSRDKVSSPQKPVNSPCKQRGPTVTTSHTCFRPIPGQRVITAFSEGMNFPENNQKMREHRMMFPHFYPKRLRSGDYF